MYSACAVLFDKFDVGDKGYIDEQEFRNFCVRAPIDLPEHVEKLMWNFLAHGKQNTINLIDFIACYHIHEIDYKDPHISRTTQMMNLDYYDMDVSEMVNFN